MHAAAAACLRCCQLASTRPRACPAQPPSTLPLLPQNIAVLFRHGEAEVSTMLFSQYLASILTLPAWTWLFLRIIHAYA